MRRVLAVLAAVAASTSIATPAVRATPPPRGLPPLADVAAAGPSSPLIGHSGFRNMPIFLNTSEEAEHEQFLDFEASLGLRWSFTALIWAAFEPQGPTSAAFDPTGAWARLDRWVEAARSRGIHLLVQPVMTGNGVAPPVWAGYRTSIGYGEEHTWTDPSGASHTSPEQHQPWWAAKPSVPLDMDALAAWYAKLARRYKPGGELAREKGWTDGYGIRAWEVDNEPDAYGFWLGANDDYAEVLTRAGKAIKAEDPGALVLGAALAQDGIETLRAVLDARTQNATLQYMLNGEQYSIGPHTDVIATHHYDEVDASGVTVFGGGSTLEETARQHRAWWDHYAEHPDQPAFHFRRGKPMWHTEGGLDYAGDDQDEHGRSRALIQYLVRGFAAGFDKMTVQDLHENKPAKVRARVAVRTFLSLLPHAPALEKLSDDEAAVRLFRADDGRRWTYVLWSGTAEAEQVSLKVRTGRALVVQLDGSHEAVDAFGGTVTVSVPGGDPVAAPIYVIEDRPAARA